MDLSHELNRMSLAKPTRLRVWWLALAACCAFPSLHATQLAFDRPHVELELPIDSQEGRTGFPFRNTSLFEVGFLEVKTECDCIQTSVTPAVVAAGQTGEVALKFRSKLRNGTELVHAKVVVGNDEMHEISVRAKLRSYIEVRPLALHWRNGEKWEAREFIVSSTGLGKLQFTKVAAVKDSKVEVRPGKEPESIRVLVTPPAGDRPFRDIVVVSAVLESTGETKLYDLHVRGE
jgi:hypothetical protein